MVLRSPAWSSWALLRVMPHKTSVCFSNMRGPRGEWALAGHRLLRLYNGVQPMAFGSFISLFSYGGGLTFTHTCFETKTRQPEVRAAYACVHCGGGGLSASRGCACRRYLLRQCAPFCDQMTTSSTPLPMRACAAAPCCQSPCCCHRVHILLQLLLQCMLQEYRVMRKAAGWSTADGSSGSDPGLTGSDGKIKAG